MLCFIVVTAAKMNFIALKIITEKSLEYECGIMKYLPPFLIFLPLSHILYLFIYCLNMSCSG